MLKKDTARESGDNWEAQLRKGCLELAVLAVLAPRRSYGLEILQALESHSNLVLSEGTIYPLLNRMRQDGTVQAEWVESGSGHPRKYYSLTSKGRDRAARMAKAWMQFSNELTTLVETLVHPENGKAPHE